MKGQQMRVKVNKKVAQRLVDECDRLYLSPDFNEPHIQREWKIRGAICDRYIKFGDLYDFAKMEKIMIDNGSITAGENPGTK